MRIRGAVAVLFLFPVFAGCSKKEIPSPRAAAPFVPGVTVARVSQEQIPELVEAVGTVKARTSAVVAARIAGSVTGVYVREGDRVARGKCLVSIDATEGGAAARAADAMAVEAERALEEAKSRQTLAEATFRRFQNLYTEKAVTRQEFEGRQMERDVATQGVARARARLDAAKEQAKGARVVADYGKVCSPIAGTVVAKQVEPGQTVFPGTPLVTVEGEGGFRLEVAAPETLLGKVRVGSPVDLVLEGKRGRGRVAEVIPTVDPATRTFLVKIDVGSGQLRSGSYGKALFPTGTASGVVVPSSAVQERGALTSVWSVSEGVARLRLIKVGRRVGDRVEILSGLNAGERIVTAGGDRVTDGARVE